MSAVLESVTFRLAPTVSVAAFTQASEATFAWVRQQPGFVQRILSSDATGLWSDQVLWQSMAQAQAASEAFMQTFGDSPFMALMNPDTVQMQHTTVHLHT